MLPKAAALLSLCFCILVMCVKCQPTNDQLMRLLDSVNAPHTGPFRHAQNAPPFFSSRGASPVQRCLQMPVTSGVINRQQNTICRDTSERSFLVSDTINYLINNLCSTANGNCLIVGLGQKSYAPYNVIGSFLVKFDVNGNIIFNKTYDIVSPTNNQWVSYLQVLELQDGSLLLAGYTSNNTTGNEDLIFTKITATGNLIWTKIFNSRLWAQGSGTLSNWNYAQLKQDPASGDVYIAGAFFYAAGSSLIRINPNTGTMLWSRSYGNSGGLYSASFGLDIRQNEIRLFAKSIRNNLSILHMYHINKTNGDTTAGTKVISPIDTTGIRQQILSPEQLVIKSNGNYLLSGGCFGYFQPLYSPPQSIYHTSVVEVDSNFSFIRAYVFKNNIERNAGSDRISIYPDGTGYFTFEYSFSTYRVHLYSVHFKDGQIIRQRRRDLNGIRYPYESNSLQLPNGGNIIVRSMDDSITSRYKIELMKLHPTDTASYCLGYDDPVSSIATLTYLPDVYTSFDSVRSNVFRESQVKTLTEINLSAVKQPGCFQVSTCDSLKLRTPQPNICQSQTLQIVARKNEGCGSAVTWTYNPAVVSSAVQANDSTLAIHFNAPWSGYIYGSIQGCAAIVDSVYINVLQSPATLNLGPDTVICPGNTLVLNAHAGYATYQWQNGSADSVFTVTQPGTYAVSVTDACSGAVFKDTVVVLAHPPVPISAGADRIKCNGDTLHLAAPAGFISYTWLPNYNINTVNGAAVVVNPAVDTAYIVRAEKTPGCFAIDTVRITVYHSATIGLGADTSLCAGQSLAVSAGAGFASYVWSNGSTAMQNNFSAAGTYTVKATTTQGCSSYDTLRILNMYALPGVALDHTAELCLGASRTLQAGAFSSYRWQDGSAASTFTASGVGTYYVQVQDSHGLHR